MLKRIVPFVLVCVTSAAFTWCNAQSKKMKNPVIAHRGAWKNTKVPQNSVASLKEAVALGCTGSEFDVRMTADGHMVVVHDASHDGVSIDSSEFSKVKALKLSNGESISTLEEYLKAGAGQKGTKLVLEIKSSQMGKQSSLLLARKCVETVKKLKLKKKVDYIAFDYDVCKLVHELDPKANIAYLNGDINPAALQKAGINGIDYHISVMKKNPNWIAEAHQAEMTVNVWTVNKKEDMQWCIDNGVDFITTDEPEILYSLLGR